MWQSFRAIGRWISEEAWRIKKENVMGITEARPELIVPGGLITTFLYEDFGSAGYKQ